MTTAVALRQCAATTRRGARCRNTPMGHTGRCHSHTLPTRGLTASVAAVDMDAVGWKEWKAGAREWQREAWRLYDITGPLRFVANWVGNSVSRCVLYVAEVDESGEPGDRATKKDVAALAAGPLGQGPAKDEALRLLGINLFTPGEAWVVAEAGVETGADGKAADRWFVVSSRQIRRSGDTIVIRRSRLHGGGEMTFRPGTDLLLQVWTPHPDNTDEPDSPARSAIPVLRAIEVIWKRIFAELDSRLTGAGVLVISQNMDFPRGDDTPAGAEGFAQLLIRTMATSMQDRSSAAAVAPIVMTAPPDEIDKLKHLTFWSELSDQLLPMLEAAVRYLAQSLDVPAEVLTGMGEASHWSAWQIEEGTVKTQIVPILNRIADALTTGYLKPALEDLGEDPEKYCYAFDTGPLTARPDRSDDALSYQQAGIISTDAAIELGALREDQKLEGEERLRWLAEKLVLAAPQLVSDPVLRKLVGFPPAPEAAQQPLPPDGVAADDPAGPPEKPEDSPPERPAVADEREEEPAPEGPPERAVKEPKPGRKAKATTAAAGHGDALIPVAALATVRALSLAGGRLVSRTQRDRWPDTPRHQLHTCVGSVDAERAEWALRGAWDDLPAVAVDLPMDPDGLRHVLHSHVVGLLASGTGYDPDGLRDALFRRAGGNRQEGDPHGEAVLARVDGGSGS